jgi:hypothetical protein
MTRGSAGASLRRASRIAGLAYLLIKVRTAGLSILTVFLCLGTNVFCYLFFKSRYIPRAPAVWGMCAFMLTMTVTFADILLPNLAAVVQTVSLISVVLFEMVIGLWLPFTGVTIQRTDGLAPESVTPRQHGQGPARASAPFRSSCPPR